MRPILLVLLALLMAGPVCAYDRVGFRRVQVPAGAEGRPLETALWYPAEDGGTATTVGDNAVFVGQPVWQGAPVAAGRHALVLLSHGYSGNWASLDWLAVELARRGYVVASMSHPGTTATDLDPVAGAKLWERPRDVSRVIDVLTRDPAWSGVLAPGPVAAIGHSLGGWTVVELAGGRLDPDRMDADCRAHPGLAACELLRRIGAGKDAASRPELAQPLADRRIKAFVSIDLGLAGGFDPASLAKIRAPVLVIASGAPLPGIPPALESRRLAARLPAASTRYVEIPGAAHFSYLPLCKPGAEAVLASGSPDDVVVCKDGPGADRAAIHQRVASAVIRFLEARLPPNG